MATLWRPEFAPHQERAYRRMKHFNRGKLLRTALWMECVQVLLCFALAQDLLLAYHFARWESILGASLISSVQVLLSTLSLRSSSISNSVWEDKPPSWLRIRSLLPLLLIILLVVHTQAWQLP